MGSRKVLVAIAFLAATLAARSQVFVVGMKTAESDVLTEFHPTHVTLPAEPLSERGHTGLIRDLIAEQGFAHRQLPLGAGITVLANGNMTPRDEAYKKMLYEKGQSAGPGDRVEISALKFENNALILDFNGGPYAKHRFISHISLSDVPLAPQGPIATGFRITLVFEGGLPEVTAQQVKDLLDPLVDFKAHTSAEAYADTLPPRVREAIQNHEILVGMDRRMVVAAVGTPKSKHREHVNEADPNSAMWEEWIYGETPEPIRFVRFREDHVVRLEIAALGKPLEIHEANEIGATPGPTLQARTIHNGDDQPDANGDKAQRRPPTLAKPGEKLDTEAPAAMGKVNIPADTPSHLVSASRGSSS